MVSGSFSLWQCFKKITILTGFPSQANTLANNLEKKQKAFDKTTGEWKQKCDDLNAELDASQREARNYSTELFKMKASNEETHEQIEALRKFRLI